MSDRAHHIACALHLFHARPTFSRIGRLLWVSSFWKSRVHPFAQTESRKVIWTSARPHPSAFEYGYQETLQTFCGNSQHPEFIRTLSARNIHPLSSCNWSFKWLDGNVELRSKTSQTTTSWTLYSKSHSLIRKGLPGLKLGRHLSNESEKGDVSPAKRSWNFLSYTLLKPFFVASVDQNE